jgi:O-antigen ligase
MLGLSIIPPSTTRLDVWPWAGFAAIGWLLPIALVLGQLALGRPQARSNGVLDLGLGLLALTATASALASPLRGVVMPHLLPVLGACALPLALLPALQPAYAPAFRRISATVIGAILLSSLILWMQSGQGLTLPISRNAEPFGHANITGSVAVLAATWMAFAATRENGKTRLLFILGVVLSVGTALSSESRGAVLAVAVAGATAAAISLLHRGRIWIFAILVIALAAGTLSANARLRDLVIHGRWSASARESNDQRTAMLVGGLRLGSERPLLGWGPGAVPHVFPRVRADLPGTADNILQLHNSPVQLWATLGAAGLLAGALIIGAMVRRAQGAVWDSERTALAAGLGAAATIILFDHSFATPAFTLLAAAHLAAWFGYPNPQAYGPKPNTTGYLLRSGRGAFFACFFALQLVPALLATGYDLAARRAYAQALDQLDANKPAGYAAGLRKAIALAPGDPYYAHQLAAYLATGHPFPSDPTPRAPAEARALLERTLTTNPDLEYAHYNLGWLLVVSEPATAARHFESAARLAPQRGAVYFGLGLARLNQNDPAGATRAFAAEWLLNPAFAWAPLWRQAPFAALQPQILAQASAAAAGLRQANPWRELETAPAASTGPTFRRLRTGYGVLMGHPENPSPVDFNIQSQTILPAELIDRVPAQGWLPGKTLLEFIALRIP